MSQNPQLNHEQMWQRRKEFRGRDLAGTSCQKPCIRVRRFPTLQNLPALILKIMRGTFSPISDQYSEELRSLILSMLHLDPARRPHINQIMACPIVVNALMNLHTDTGRVACVR